MFPQEDNADITYRLEAAGIISPGTKTDSESGEMNIYFTTEDEANEFYDKLWNYLRTRWLAIYNIKKQLRELP